MSSDDSTVNGDGEEDETTTTVTTTTEESRLQRFGEEAKSWIEEDANFITIMIIVASVLLVFGVFMVICFCRYPSYDYPDNLRKGRITRKRRGGRKGSQESVISSSGQLERLPHDNTTFHPRISTASREGSNSYGNTTTRLPHLPPNYRLPTPGNQLPAGRLPPLEPLHPMGLIVSEANSVNNSRLMLIENEEESMSVRDGGRGGASTPIQDVSVRAAAAGRAAVRSTADDVDSLGGGGGGSTNFYHNLHPHHKNSW